MFDWNEYNRWMDQAKYTLSSIRADIDYGSYSWACFKAHQAVEYALKAFLRGAGKSAFGHDLRELFNEIKEYCQAEKNIEEYMLLLSKYYIPPRYPDAFPGGAPYKFYTLQEAKEAFSKASKIIDWVSKCVERLRKTSERAYSRKE